jgi:DNA-binding NarL/FixJ family response regulator
MLRILTIDDHEVVRAGIKGIFTSDAEEFGEARSGAEALKLVREHDWDVAVLDISLGGRSGLEVLKEIKQLKPRLPVLMLSMHAEAQYAIRAFKGGAAGYVSKDSSRGELRLAILKVIKGGRYISPESSSRKPLKSRIGSALPDRLWKNGRGDRRASCPQRQNHQHLSTAHPRQNGDEDQRRARHLRDSQPSGRLTLVRRMPTELSQLAR